MSPRTRRRLVRDLVALGLVAGLVGGGIAWRRRAEAGRRWEVVALESEGIRFRLPPGWRSTPLGYAAPAFDAREGAGGLVLTVRSFAIPPEMRHLAPDGGAEAAALAAWADGQRAGSPHGQRLVSETRVRIDGARAVLQVFEDRRDTLPISVVAGAARDGRLYTFQSQAGPGVRPADAARTLRRILRTVEWTERPAPAASRN